MPVPLRTKRGCDIMTDELGWQNYGSCRQADPEIFFVLPDESADQARMVCAQCPVIQECGDWAIATNQRYGIWGGMTRRERVKVATGGRPVILTMRGCLLCGMAFMPKHCKQVYCSAKCRIHADSAKRWAQKKRLQTRTAS